MITLTIGTALIGLVLALAFAYSMSKPIFAAMHIAERVAAGIFTDQIVVRRRDELGRLLKSLAVMQTNLKTRADEDIALMSTKDQMTSEQVGRRQRIGHRTGGRQRRGQDQQRTARHRCHDRSHRQA